MENMNVSISPGKWIEVEENSIYKGLRGYYWIVMNRPILNLWNKTLFKMATPDFMKLLSCIKKAECQRIDAFELWCWRRLLRVPWTARRSNQSILKRNHSCIFIGRTDAEAETPILWPPDARNWFIWKDPDAGKDWRLEEKGMTENEMVGWHHRLNGHEWVNSGNCWWIGGLVCCSPWGCKQSDATEWLNWTELNFHVCTKYQVPRITTIYAANKKSCW